MVQSDLDTFFIGLCASAAFKYAYLIWGHKRRPSTAKLVGKVTGIWYHPVKSCQGISLERAECREEGLRPVDGTVGDRTVMVINEEGRYSSMMHNPKMAFIATSVYGNAVRLDAPGMPSITVPLDPPVKKVMPSCRLARECIDGLDLGDEAAKWLTTFLGDPLRLVYSANDMKKRQLSPTKTHPLHRAYGYEEVAEARKKIGFVNFGPYMMMTQVSLDDLNTRINPKMTFKNFRPNMVISGTEPYEEDTWGQIYVGDQVKFRNFAECPRCPVTTVDQDKGEKRADNEPLNTLKTYRHLPISKGIGMGPSMGRYIFADFEGIISVGDDVYAIVSPKAS